MVGNGKAVASLSLPMEWLISKVAISMTTELMVVASLSQEWQTSKAAISITTKLLGWTKAEK